MGVDYPGVIHPIFLEIELTKNTKARLEDKSRAAHVEKDQSFSVIIKP